MLAMAVALYLAGRQAGDFERIRLEQSSIVIEVSDFGTKRIDLLDSYWARLIVETNDVRGVALCLQSRDTKVPIGRHRDEAGRLVLARQLHLALVRRRRPA
jgi:uncharacterized membrane protein